MRFLRRKKKPLKRAWRSWEQPLEVAIYKPPRRERLIDLLHSEPVQLVVSSVVLIFTLFLIGSILILTAVADAPPPSTPTVTSLPAIVTRTSVPTQTPTGTPTATAVPQGVARGRAVVLAGSNAEGIDMRFGGSVIGTNPTDEAMWVCFEGTGIRRRYGDEEEWVFTRVPRCFTGTWSIKTKIELAVPVDMVHLLGLNQAEWPYIDVHIFKYAHPISYQHQCIAGVELLQCKPQQEE